MVNLDDDGEVHNFGMLASMAPDDYRVLEKCETSLSLYDGWHLTTYRSRRTESPSIAGDIPDPNVLDNEFGTVDDEFGNHQESKNEFGNTNDKLGNHEDQKSRCQRQYGKDPSVTVGSDVGGAMFLGEPPVCDVTSATEGQEELDAGDESSSASADEDGDITEEENARAEQDGQSEVGKSKKKKKKVKGEKKEKKSKPKKEKKEKAKKKSKKGKK